MKNLKATNNVQKNKQVKIGKFEMFLIERKKLALTGGFATLVVLLTIAFIVGYLQPKPNDSKYRFPTSNEELTKLNNTQKQLLRVSNDLLKKKDDEKIAQSKIDSINNDIKNKQDIQTSLNQSISGLKIQKDNLEEMIKTDQATASVSNSVKASNASSGIKYTNFDDMVADLAKQYHEIPQNDYSMAYRDSPYVNYAFTQYELHNGDKDSTTQEIISNGNLKFDGVEKNQFACLLYDIVSACKNNQFKD